MAERNQNNVLTLQKRVAEFGELRGWKKFHSPKNVSMALCVETAEMMEIFQWMTEEESRILDTKTLQHAGSEIADIFMYTLLLCERLGLNLVDEAEKKLAENEQRFKLDTTVKAPIQQNTDQ